MKKRVLSFILVVLMVFGMIPMTLLSAFAEEVGELIDQTPKISIEPTSVHTGKIATAKPDASGYAHFVIKADSDLKESVTVYYKTADLSAIAQAGDYEAESSSVVLTPDKSEVEITIKTSLTVYGVASFTIKSRGARQEWVKDSYTSRSFEVLLTGIEGDGAILDSDKSRAECALNAENVFEAIRYEGETRYAYTPFTAEGVYSVNNFLTTEAIDGGDPDYQKKETVFFPSNWNQYLDTGIDAKLYLALNDAHIDESSWNSSSLVTVMLFDSLFYGDGVTIVMEGEFHNDEWFGWESPIIYADTGNEGDDGRHKEAYTDNFGYILWRTYDGSIVKLKFREDFESINFGRELRLGSHFSKDYIIKRYTNGSYNERYGAVGGDLYYIALQDLILNKDELSLNFNTEGGYSRRLDRGDLLFRLEDITDPTVKNEAGVYEIYHNFDTVVEGEKLRLAVRLTEPVQIDGINPFIEGKVNGRGAGTVTDPYRIRFNYVGGSGTDTLYFEADYTGDYLITSITDMYILNFHYVWDYAAEANNLDSGWFGMSGFTLDRRPPVINVENSEFTSTTNPIKSTSVNVTVGQITDGAKLHYSWTDSSTTPTSYDFTVDLNQISIYETQTVNINVGGDGKKHLHVMAESRYGKTTTIILNSQTGMTKSYLGPYYFDNSAPSFSETILPLSGESDLTKKVYKIPLPDENPSDAASGFYEMKMYYVIDGVEKVVKRADLTTAHGKHSHDLNAFIEKDFTLEENGKRYLTLTLEAADVGVGEKTRVENVEIYFTLTDNIGNASIKSGRHITVFDTNEYINVTSAGASFAFADETQKVEGENTFIYTNEKSLTSNGETVSFSFDLSIIENASNCEYRFEVNKIGDNNTRTVISPDAYSIIISNGANLNEKIVTIAFTSPLENGSYDVQLLCYDKDSDLTDKADRVSEIYRIYVGSGAGKLSEKIEEGTVLINKVYQIPGLSSFYYMGRSDDANATVNADAILSEYYNSKKLPMSFSSIEEARKYILFNEYRDLYAITINEALAEALNNKTSSAQPAQGENTVAQAGQVWIRYKSVSWSVGTKLSSNWAYYYYGSSETLEPEKFSAVLNEALNHVVNAVIKTGSTVALTDISLKNQMGESLVDEYGAPYLDPSQIVLEDLYLSDSTTKISDFAKEIKYNKDSAIYSSKVVVTKAGIGREYVLIGNLDVPTGTRFQYRRYNTVSAGYVSHEWLDLEVGEGTQKFRDLIAEDGTYEIRELSANGVTLYDVYIDKKAPTLSVSWFDKNGVAQTQWLSSESEKDFRTASIEIRALDELEADKYSYVAIYEMMKLEKPYGVYTLTELKRAAVRLPDGKYYLVIADRSGNSYWLALYVNSSSLNCQIDETENVRIKFTCDRDASQIQSFYVKRDGVLLNDKPYASTMTFSDSGTYEFFVEDIYGNKFGPYTYEFSRDYPHVEWSYLEGGSYFEKYNKDTPSDSFKLEETDEGSYRITTSVPVRFQITGDYSYTFIGVAPDADPPSIHNYVTINSVQNFQLKVYYNGYPDVYTIYTCSADRTAPAIDVSAAISVAKPLELDYLKDAVKNSIENGIPLGVYGSIFIAGESVNGRFLTPETIAYSAGETKNRRLIDGETVLSDFIRVNATDENGLLKQEIYLDGELISSQNSKTGFSEIILNRAGSYRIVAVDALGNQSEFSFKNSSPDAFEYRVDGELVPLGLHDYQYFDSDLNYTAEKYGNSSVSFTLSESMSVFYMISDSNGAKSFVAFDVKDGIIRELHYFLKDGASVPELFSGEAIYDATQNYASNERLIHSANGISIYAKLENGKIVLSVYANKNDAFTVEARLTTTDGEFYYNKTELSTLPFDLVIKKDGEIVSTTTEGQINLNKAFEISDDNFENANIVSVEVYFSKFNDLDAANLSGRENIYGKESYSDEGFYLVRAFDKYGNVRIYKIHLSSKFDSTPYVEFLDGVKIHYSADFNGSLFSDSKIVFEIHSESVEVSVIKDGASYTAQKLVSNGVTLVTLTEAGAYKLSFLDIFGNELKYSAEINKTSSAFNENLLIGYNENALRKDEGYTNQKLSVVESILKEELSYLAVSFGDSVTVIYDILSENSVALDTASLFECIGASGDGEYLVTARNKYGSMATKRIYYRATPTLKLERETRGDVEAKPYSLADAILNGFWSNNTLIFTSEAAVYQFKVNGEVAECPKTISFGTSEMHGRSQYLISYVDEYGFSYTFTAYLVRQDVTVSLTEDLTTVSINDILTTKDNVSVIFSENAFCTYTLNNSEPIAYNGGKLTKDGVYRFTVFDLAGNVSSVTIKKDTVAEFYFKSNKSPSLQSGEVVNYSKVEFSAANGDSSFIEKVLKNGVVQKDFDGTIFTEDGKWEVIIADKLGNKSYFSFYILTREQNGFSYTTPYEYHITELWFVGADGTKVSYMSFVDHTDTSSSFSFIENGKYTVSMVSNVSGKTSTFNFTVNTAAPKVSLVGCKEGETTINDVSVEGCKVGDTVKIYKATEMGETLVKEVTISSLTMDLPTVSEGGTYRIVVESEAGVTTELNFVRKHVMNTSGSIFIMILVGVAAAGLFAGLVYRNKSKTDD